MSRKRNCGIVGYEAEEHAMAVKARKMTDRQITEYIAGMEKAARKAVDRERSESMRPGPDIDGIMGEIATIKGIGEARQESIREILRRRLGGTV